jgi:hypothetical protein
MSDLQLFTVRLHRFSRARRGLRNAAVGYRLGTWALLAGIAGLLLLSGWLPGAILNLALAAVLVIVLLALALSAGWQWDRFRSALDEAFQLEELAGGLDSRVVSAWDFLASDRLDPLTQAVIRRARQDLEADHEARLDRRDRNRRRRWFLAVLVVLVAVGLTPWFGFGAVAANLQRHWTSLREYLFPVAYQLVPGPGAHHYLVGTPVEVGLFLPEPVHAQVRLIRQSGADTQVFDLPLDSDGRARQAITSDIEAEITLHFEFGDRRTDAVTLIFSYPPTLVNMQTELVYPAYTRLVPRSLEGVQPRLIGLPNTRMTLGFTFSQELESATITWDEEDTPPLPLETTGRFATTSLLHTRPRTARLQVVDRHGFGLESEVRIAFEVQEDEKPVVSIPRQLKLDMPLLADGARLFGFGAQAQDDFGIGRVILKWQKSTVDNPNSVQDRGEVERQISPVQPKVLISFEKVFAALDLRPGDKVTFWVEAQDNRVPGPQLAKSPNASFFIYQDALGGLSIKELGFGAGMELGRERIPKSIRATTVKAPEGLKTREGVRNEFQADIISGTRPPTVHGDYRQATQDYFRVLSGAKYLEEEGSGARGQGSEKKP